MRPKLAHTAWVFAPITLFLQLRHCGSSAGVAHGRPRARVPHLVGSRLPSPYHFRARIQSFQGIAAPFPGDSTLSSDPLAPRNFLRDRIDPLERPRGGGGRAPARAKRSDPDQGSPTAAWSGYLFAISQIATACPLAPLLGVKRLFQDVATRFTRAYQTWPDRGCTKAKAPGGVGHAGSCHEF